MFIDKSLRDVRRRKLKVGQGVTSSSYGLLSSRAKKCKTTAEMCDDDSSMEFVRRMLKASRPRTISSDMSE